MAAGRPTVLAIDGVIRDVMEQADGGIFVPPGNDAELAAAILRLRNAREEAARMGARARKYVTEHLDRRTQAEKFLEVTTELCGKR
jgi:glycosyltransferase involved in cell wall biosynthesis